MSYQFQQIPSLVKWLWSVSALTAICWRYVPVPFFSLKIPQGVTDPEAFLSNWISDALTNASYQGWVDETFKGMTMNFIFLARSIPCISLYSNTQGYNSIFGCISTWWVLPLRMLTQILCKTHSCILHMPVSKFPTFTKHKPFWKTFSPQQHINVMSTKGAVSSDKTDAGWCLCCM